MAAFAHGSMALVPSNVNRDEGSGEAPTQTEPMRAVDAAAPNFGKIASDFFQLNGDAGFEPPANVILTSHADNDDANATATLDPGETKEFLLLDSATASGSLMTDATFTATTYVSEVSFEGMSFAVPDLHPVQVPGNFGTLTIRSDGTFIYRRTIHGEDFADAFTCTARNGTERTRVTLRITTEQEDTSSKMLTA